MFGMGFMEILLIAIIAIVALGPDKLPGAMVEVAKFIKKFKSGVADAKTTLDNELNLDEMKQEANKFKAQIEDTKSSFDMNSKVDLGLDEILRDDNVPSQKEDLDTKAKNKDEKVSFKKKKKAAKEEKSVEDSNEEFMQNAANKFKVNFDDDKKDTKEGEA